MRCEASGVLVAKDKAIKRFIVRNIVDASAIRDIQDSSVIESECQLLECRGSLSHPQGCTPAFMPASVLDTGNGHSFDCLIGTHAQTALCCIGFTK